MKRLSNCLQQPTQLLTHGLASQRNPLDSDFWNWDWTSCCVYWPPSSADSIRTSCLSPIMRRQKSFSFFVVNCSPFDSSLNTDVASFSLKCARRICIKPTNVRLGVISRYVRRSSPEWPGSQQPQSLVQHRHDEASVPNDQAPTSLTNLVSQPLKMFQTMLTWPTQTVQSPDAHSPTQCN